MAIWSYLHPSISTALMRPRRPKQYCLQLVIYIYMYIYIYIYIYIHQIIYDLVALSSHFISSNFLFSKRKSFGHFDGYGLVGHFQSVSFSSKFSHPFSPLFYFHLVIFCQLCKAISIFLKEILCTIKRTHNGVTHFLR